MEITGGLVGHMVLQRNNRNVSDATLAGSCASPGTIQIRATRRGQTLPGLNWKSLAQVKAGKFSVPLAGIPVGGPYTISIRHVPAKGGTPSEFHADDVLVGDVWILAGQSNMQGIGLLKDAAKPMPMVRAFYMHDEWAPAKDPIHNLCDAVDAVHTDLNGGTPWPRSDVAGVGPGVAFGQAMFKFTGVPQGLIACAHGGTSMSQWSPDLKNLEGKSLYGATLRRFHKNGARVAGIVWYQGCSDTNSVDAKLYTDRMKKLVAAFRRDLGDKNLPFVMVQIATFFPSTVTNPDQEKAWNSVQDQERRLPKIIKNLTTVPAVDLGLDDCIHISGKDQYRLGRRLAEATCTLLKHKAALKPPIELKSVKHFRDPRTAGLTIEVAFDHVHGALRSEGRPAGFAVVDTEGDNAPVHTIYRVDLEKNVAILRTCLPSDYDDGSLAMAYGYGLHAYCNITDEADRSLPVFAPVPLRLATRARQPVRTVRISRILPGAGKLQTVKCPNTADKTLRWASRTFPTVFCNLHDVLQNKTDDALVFYATKFACDEPMKLKIGFGYDGPVKMWIDRKQIFFDPDGINPMIADQKMIPYAATRGTHEIVVAFSANFGKAWGIALNLYRPDIPARVVKKGREFCRLPQILG